MPTTPFIRETSPSYYHLYSPSLSNCINQSPPPDTSDSECELKDFFFGSYIFKPAPNEPLSPTLSYVYSESSMGSAGSTIGSEYDEVRNVFVPDKDSYDFESQLPLYTTFVIQEMLEEPDAFDSRFGGNHKGLNPQAALFVPQQPTRSIQSPRTRLRDRVLASTSCPLIPPPPLRPLKANPLWMTIFHSASTTSPISSIFLIDRATELVHSRFWHSEALAELAQHYCWKASAANTDVNRETMAPFAWEVYRALYTAFDEDTAESFVCHLRNLLIGTFEGCWFATESFKAISYRFTPSEEYVTSATWLAAFIGDLFTFGLIRVQHIKLCLNILVHELISLQHISAISVMIDHAGPQFWCYPGGVRSTTLPLTMAKVEEPSREMINLFLRNFLPKTAKLQNGNSVLARKVVAGSSEKDKKVNEVLDILAQWCPDLRAQI
ncbi:hypothetical protein GGU11DRAFT_767293 [Lentinula aff. detonsa]|nr:hypothetical protein GGU11DRAFT_767293 [Lentinula aff. detonsa]